MKSIKNIKDKCVSCGNAFNNTASHYRQFGNYCLTCDRKAGKKANPYAYMKKSERDALRTKRAEKLLPKEKDTDLFELATMAAVKHSVKISEVLTTNGRGSTARCIAAKKFVIRRLRDKYGWSFNRIADEMGYTDHTTVIGHYRNAHES